MNSLKAAVTNIVGFPGSAFAFNLNQFKAKKDLQII